MNDNVKRSLRTLLQVVLGIAATGGVTKVWESFNGSHIIDPTWQVVAGLACIAIVAWAQNVLEDSFGGGILVPTDRVVGDAALGTGLGYKRLEDGKLTHAETAALMRGTTTAQAAQAARAHTLPHR